MSEELQRNEQDEGGKYKPVKKIDRNKLDEILEGFPDSPYKTSSVSKKEEDFYAQERKRLHNESLAQDLGERKKYAKWIFIMLCAWLAIILIAVFLIGFGLMELSDSVLITLITTSTAAIIGIFLIVVRYLFHRADLS